MENEELKKAVKEIGELGDNELNLLLAIAHEEAIKREAKKMILRLMNEQK